eukprot:1454758-Prymnesium_polylepis.1
MHAQPVPPTARGAAKPATTQACAPKDPWIYSRSTRSLTRPKEVFDSAVLERVKHIKAAVAQRESPATVLGEM